MKVGSELQIYERAMRQNWDIKPEAFSKIPKRLLEITLKGADRDSVKAAALLKEMHEANQEPTPTAGPQPQLHLHAEVTGTVNGNPDSERLAILDRVRALLGRGGGASPDRVVVVEPTAGTPVVSRRKPAAKDSGKGRKTPGRAARNRRDTSGK